MLELFRNNKKELICPNNERVTCDTLCQLIMFALAGETYGKKILETVKEKKKWC